MTDDKKKATDAKLNEELKEVAGGVPIPGHLRLQTTDQALQHSSDPGDTTPDIPGNNDS